MQYIRSNHERVIIHMRFPNAYKGIKKMLSGGIMMATASALIVVMAVMMSAVEVGTVATITELPREQALMIGDLSLVLTLAIIVLGLVGLILNFVGVIQAKKDDSNFSSAFFTALLSVVFAFIEIRRWLSLGNTVCVILTRVFVLSGIASLAAKMADSKIKAVAEKARVIVCAVSIGSVAAILIAAYLPDAVFLEFVGYGLSIGSITYYLTVLAKGKKMLAG